MRVLFVPHPMPSHFFPLVALERTLGDGVESAFLLPEALHRLGQAIGVGVLDVDRDFERRFLSPELRAFATFSPDVVVDDFSYTTAYAARMRRVPRVAVVRKGVFPDDPPRNPEHSHSGQLQWLMDSWPLGRLGVPKPKAPSDLFHGDVKLVPSVPSVEPLPEAHRDDPSYVYCGPLLVDDATVLSHIASFDASLLREVREGWGASGADFAPTERVEAFLDRHAGKRPIVYVTIGMARHADLAPVLPECLDFLLERGAAVVTNVAPGEAARAADRLFYSAFLPMDLVCSKSDLMIHQCGSGTYGYQLVHRLPAITLGTTRFDRDDVAVRLQELEASLHIPSPSEEEGFVERFRSAVDRLLAPGPERDSALAASSALADEIRDVRDRFDFDAVLRRTVATH